MFSLILKKKKEKKTKNSVNQTVDLYAAPFQEINS